MEMLQWIRELVSIVAGLAVIVGVGWGLKLARAVVKTKDATIQQKGATIELKDAQIEQLSRITAPDLARENEQMAGRLNQAAKEKRELQEQLAKLESSEKISKKAIRLTEEVALARQRYAALALKREATSAAIIIFYKFLITPGTKSQIDPNATVRVSDIADELSVRVDGIRQVADELANNKEPTFPNSSLFESLHKGRL